MLQAFNIYREKPKGKIIDFANFTLDNYKMVLHFIITAKFHIELSVLIEVQR